MILRKIHKRNGRAAAVLPVLLALIFLTSALPVKADVIYEPYGDDFYAEHAGECRIVDEGWEINARGARMMESPESDRAVYEFDTIGTRIWLYAVYDNPKGGSWGYTEYYKDGDMTSGWIPMGLLWKGYDHEKFTSDYAASISQKRNTVPVVSKEDSQKVYFYAYPGSPYYSMYELNTEDLQDDPIYTDVEYKDEEGRKWGYVSYYYQMKGWICLDYPDRDFDALWPSGAPDYDNRNRKYYEVTYRENESEVAEIPDPDGTVSASEEGSRASKEPGGTVYSVEPGESEETVRPTEQSRDPAETENNLEETTAAPSPGPSGEKLRFVIPAAIAGVAVISAAIVLIVIFGKKKK